MILFIGGVMSWGALIAFYEPCVSIWEKKRGVFEKNAFEAEDKIKILVMLSDILSAIILKSIGITFAKWLLCL